jgi:hypothetical protein
MLKPNKKIKLREDGNKYVTKAKVNSKGELTDVKVRRTLKGLVTGAPSVKKAEAISKMKKGGTAIPKGYHKMPDGTIMKDSAHKKTKKKK